MILPDELTYGETLKLAQAVTTEAEAADLLRALAERCARLRPCSLEEGYKISRDNIGYLGGYCDVETQSRFEALFGAVHPIFGAVDSPESPKTAAETFERGAAIGRAARDRGGHADALLSLLLALVAGLVLLDWHAMDVAIVGWLR